MHFKKITDKSDKLWNIGWNIYKDSFPIFEQRTINNQIEAMKDDKFNCRVYLEDENVIGILFFWEWEKYRYIEHFAINSQMRGKNYGSKILKEFCEDEYITILEIDLPIDKISISRLNFYERLGFKMNKYDHVHPPYRENYEGHNLKILSYSDILDDVNYNNFNDFLQNNVMKYSEKYCNSI